MPAKVRPQYGGVGRIYAGIRRKHTVPSASVTRLINHQRRLRAKAARTNTASATSAADDRREREADPRAEQAAERAWIRSEEQKVVYAALNNYVPRYSTVRRWRPDFVDTDGRVYYCADRKRDQDTYAAMNISDGDGTQTIVFVLLPILETKASESSLDFPSVASQELTVYRPRWPTANDDPETWLRDVTHRRVEVYKKAFLLPIDASDMGHRGRAVGILVVPTGSITAALKLPVFPPALAATATATAAAQPPPPQPPPQTPSAIAPTTTATPVTSAGTHTDNVDPKSIVT